MRFDPFGVTFHTAYDKAKCKEIISASTVKGREGSTPSPIEIDSSGGDRTVNERETSSTLRGDRVVSILRGDRIQLASCRALYGKRPLVRIRAGYWTPYFVGELQSSVEGTRISGKLRFIPDTVISLSFFAVYLPLVSLFAFLAVIGLISRVVSGSPDDLPGGVMFWLLPLPFIGAVLMLIYAWLQTRQYLGDIYDIFRVELKAKRLA